MGWHVGPSGVRRPLTNFSLALCFEQDLICQSYAGDLERFRARQQTRDRANAPGAAAFHAVAVEADSRSIARRRFTIHRPLSSGCCSTCTRSHLSSPTALWTPSNLCGKREVPFPRGLGHSRTDSRSSSTRLDQPPAVEAFQAKQPSAWHHRRPAAHRQQQVGTVQ
jgi:hypothetical protein